VNWSYVIYPNCVFSSWLWRNQTSNNQLWRHFSDVTAITSPKKRHQNNVTKLFYSGPPHQNFWLYIIYLLHCLLERVYDWQQFYCKNAKKFLNTMQKISTENSLPLPWNPKIPKWFHFVMTSMTMFNTNENLFNFVIS